MPKWKAIRYRLEAIGCEALAALIPCLPRGMCDRLAAFAGAVAFRLDAHGRAVALQNLECVFGARFSPAERWRIGSASYSNFARTMLALFWSPRLTPENYGRWIHLEGLEAVLEQMKREKRGAVFACSHFGNWEWANIGGAYAGASAVTVAENFKNPRLTEIFQRLREHSGASLIRQENALLRMMKVAKREGVASLMVDLSLPPTQAAAVIEAFRPAGGGEGLAMCIPLLHAVLAQRVGALLVPVETRPLPGGACKVIVHPPVQVAEGDSLPMLVEKCWRAFEPFIHARPEFYLWPYKHFRYRPKHAAREYPAYSKPNGRFEKLRRAQAAEAARSGA